MSVAPTAPAKQFNFGFSVTPAYKGTTVAPLHDDTFSILAPYRLWRASLIQ